MINVAEDTILIGATELRTEVPMLMKMKKKVIVMKRGKPIGVLQNFDDYEAQEKILDAFEDIVLGYLAKERFENATNEDYVDIDVMRRKLGING
ncbi:MAG: hypothetical protein ACD_65C00334G0003 [uncultured bacterium]|nr:MAG: hypothetical protein ACD_65C00334G0003 [uncultured bacterium]OGJ47830.1 MAG: hypothetical protein A2344_01550 [Candidatus Peregrinibacteria bacterium RIFOXYB12_FULL_41_12]OGJ52670.1 MAG: hypothetical protein A2336_02820 [Candidatus Peregrinibacteria bacterium RIFOXYB2_FULL_41_88]